MKLYLEQASFLQDVIKLIMYAYQEGFIVTGGELQRTPEQQQIYVDSGKSKTMNSMHLKKCAIDLNFFIDGGIIGTKEYLQKLGNYWESLSDKNRWGGNFEGFIDTPHFERGVK